MISLNMDEDDSSAHFVLQSGSFSALACMRIDVSSEVYCCLSEEAETREKMPYGTS